LCGEYGFRSAAFEAAAKAFSASPFSISRLVRFAYGHWYSGGSMALSRSAVQELYTTGIDRYSSLIAAFRSQQGMQELLQSSPLLRTGLRVLDAGCGFGMATFAFIEALRQKNLDYKSIDGFDLTPAMLSRFQETLEAQGVTRVQLRQADVLALETLPSSWTNYDLSRLRCSSTFRRRIFHGHCKDCARVWPRTVTGWL